MKALRHNMNRAVPVSRSQSTPECKMRSSDVLKRNRPGYCRDQLGHDSCGLGGGEVIDPIESYLGERATQEYRAPFTSSPSVPAKTNCDGTCTRVLAVAAARTATAVDVEARVNAANDRGEGCEEDSRRGRCGLRARERARSDP